MWLFFENIICFDLCFVVVDCEVLCVFEIVDLRFLSIVLIFSFFLVFVINIFLGDDNLQMCGELVKFFVSDFLLLYYSVFF